MLFLNESTEVENSSAEPSIEVANASIELSMEVANALALSSMEVANESTKPSIEVANASTESYTERSSKVFARSCHEAHIDNFSTSTSRCDGARFERTQ